MSTSSQSKHTGLTRQLTKTPSSHTVRHAKPSWAPTIVVIEAPPPYSDSTEASSRSNDSSKLAMPLKSQNNTLPRPFIVDDEKLPLRAAPVHGDPTVSVLNRQEEPIQTTCRLAQHEQSITAGPTRNKKPGQPLRSTVPVHEDPTDALYENATLANPAPPATPSPPPNSVSKHSASPARSAATNCSKPFSPASEATPLAAPPKDEFPKDELCTALDVLSKKPVPGIELVVKGLREVIESCSPMSGNEPGLAEFQSRIEQLDSLAPYTVLPLLGESEECRKASRVFGEEGIRARVIEHICNQVRQPVKNSP